MKDTNYQDWSEGYDAGIHCAITSLLLNGQKLMLTGELEQHALSIAELMPVTREGDHFYMTLEQIGEFVEGLHLD